MDDILTVPAKVMAGFIDEVIEESFGKSRKKWALLVLALLVGAGVGLFVTRKLRAAKSSAPGTDQLVAEGESITIDVA